MNHIADLISIPTQETKHLSDQEKKWSLQREIFSLVETKDDLRPFNWKRYIAFLKKYHLAQHIIGQKECIRRWRASSRNKADADVKPIQVMDKRTFGIFTRHLDEEALWFLLSVAKDRKVRNECVTTYILSLQKFSTLDSIVEVL